MAEDLFIDDLSNDDVSPDVLGGDSDGLKLEKPIGDSDAGDGAPAPDALQGSSGTDPSSEPNVPQPDGLQKTPYTAEELSALLESDGEIDTSRLSAEGRAIQKSFQRGLDKKFKELSEQRREPSVQQRQEPSDPKEKLFREYMQKPGDVLRRINAEIEKLEASDPAEENYGQKRRDIARFQALKEEFRDRKEQVLQFESVMDRVSSESERDLLTAYPDYFQKAEQLTQFALDAGLDRNTVNILTDPRAQIVLPDGRLIFMPAAAIAKAVYKLFGKSNIGKSADSKEVKKGQSLGRPGSGSGDKTVSKTKTPDEMSYEEYKAMRKKQGAM